MTSCVCESNVIHFRENNVNFVYKIMTSQSIPTVHTLHRKMSMELVIFQNELKSQLTTELCDKHYTLPVFFFLSKKTHFKLIISEMSKVIHSHSKVLWLTHNCNTLDFSFNISCIFSIISISSDSSMLLFDLSNSFVNNIYQKRTAHVQELLKDNLTWFIPVT